MTVAGVYADGRRGFAWADVEVFVGDHVAGRQDKITANHCGGFAMTTFGLSRILEPAATTALRCGDLDEALRRVPLTLREVSGKAMEKGASGDDIATTAIGLVGYSRRHRAVVAFEADGARWFQPRRVRAHLWCGDADLRAELIAMHPQTASDIVAVAVPQLVALQRDWGPDAGLIGDAVHVATVTRDAVAVRPFRLPPLAPSVPSAPHIAPAEPPALRLVPRDAPMTYQPQRLAHS